MLGRLLSPGTVLLLVTALVCVIWVLVIISIRPKAFQNRGFWGRTAVLLAVLGALLPLELAPRTMTPFGITTPPSSYLLLLGRLLGYVGVAAALLAFATNRTANRRLPRAGLIGLYLLAVAQLVGSLFGPSTDVNLTPLFLVIIIHAAALAYLEDPVMLMRMLRLVARSAVVASLFAALMSPTWAWFAEDDRFLGLDRLTGVMPHPNSMALLATAAFIIEWVPARSRLSALFAMLAAIAAALTQSDTGWIVLAVVTVVVTYGRVKRRFRFFYGLLLASAAVYVLAATSVVSSFVNEIGVDRLSSFSDRTQIWRIALTEYRSHPWFGLGDYFLSADYRQLNLSDTMQQASHAHNQVFQTMGESGTVGLFGLLVLVLAVIGNAVRQRNQDGDTRIAMVMWLLLFGMTEVPLRAYGASAVPGLLVLPLLLAPHVGVAGESAGPLDDHADERGGQGLGAGGVRGVLAHR